MTAGYPVARTMPSVRRRHPQSFGRYPRPAPRYSMKRDTRTIAYSLSAPPRRAVTASGHSCRVTRHVTSLRDVRCTVCAVRLRSYGRANRLILLNGKSGGWSGGVVLRKRCQGLYWLARALGPAYPAPAHMVHATDQFEEGWLVVPAQWFWLEQISERGYRLMSEERLIPVSTTVRLTKD